MPFIDCYQLFPYPTALMFSIANDIEHYPTFMPGCHRAIVRCRKKDEVVATLVVMHGLFRESFTTRNRMIDNKRIDISLVDGPFHVLHGGWRFVAQGEEQCKVSLELRFQLSNYILRCFSPVIVNSSYLLLDALRHRAQQVVAKQAHLLPRMRNK